MEFASDGDIETLKNLIKSSLLEMNKLKSDITVYEVETFKDDSQQKIHDLENHILEKEKEVSIMKFQAEDEIKLLKQQLEEKDGLIKEQENKIYELDYVTNSLEEIKEYFAGQLKQYKEEELSQLNDRLTDSYRSIAEKDAKISSLSRELDESKIEVIKLQNNSESQNVIRGLEKDIEIKNKEISEIHNQLNLLKEKSVSKQDYFLLKEELVKKDSKIKRLEEINEFFNELREEEQAFNTQEDVPPFRLDKK